MSSNEEIINKIKQFFEEESLKKENVISKFSDDVVNLAYQKLTANLTDLIQNEEDPMVIAELLKNFLETSKLVDERGLPRQQFLLKLYEQLTKYEQSRYY